YEYISELPTYLLMCTLFRRRINHAASIEAMDHCCGVGAREHCRSCGGRVAVSAVRSWFDCRRSGAPRRVARTLTLHGRWRLLRRRGRSWALKRQGDPG